MKAFISLSLTILFSSASVFGIDCSKFCVISVVNDTVPGKMLVTIYNGDTVHVNYPTVQVIDSNGDTIGNPSGSFDLFAHMSGDTLVYSIPATSPLPASFVGTVLITDQIWDTTCSFSYPMACTVTPYPDCNDLVVSDIYLYSGGDSMAVTVYNTCQNCASGANGPVYCEMTVTRSVMPYDTLGESYCYCYQTPHNLSSWTYRIPSNVSTLPPLSDITVRFFCGPGICDTLTISPGTGIREMEGEGAVIFPNPASESATIKVPASQRIYSVRVIALSGKLVPVARQDNRLDVGALASGLYFIHVSTREQEFVLKFLKE